MRLVPRSLFGRMVLIFLVGLVMAQSLSATILLRDRDKLLFRLGATQSAQRIADIVNLLDSLDPAGRQKAIADLGARGLKISPGEPPLQPAGSAVDEESPAAVFEAILRDHLGDDRPMRVKVAGTAPPARAQPSGPGDGMRELAASPMGRLAPREFSVAAQVRLRDGTWITFEHRLPQGLFAGHYRPVLNLLILLASVIVLSLIAVRWATRPLFVLATAAEELGHNINRPPLAEKGPVEVRRAAHAFNTMQQRLVHYIQERTRILAAVSHDLKTPITRLRLRTELLDDEGLRAKFSRDLEEMESMVAAALDFMRGMDQQEPVQPVDIMALLEAIQADGEEMGRRIDIEGNPSGPYPGRPQALKRCLGNLTDNAVHYGRRATIRVDDDPTRLCIRIRDEGPGIPEEELERVFEPFYRVEASRSRDSGGTGLGLSIARNIARAHGGDLILRNLPGGGLEATLTLPRPKGG